MIGIFIVWQLVCAGYLWCGGVCYVFYEEIQIYSISKYIAHASPFYLHTSGLHTDNNYTYTYNNHMYTNRNHKIQARLVQAWQTVSRAGSANILWYFCYRDGDYDIFFSSRRRILGAITSSKRETTSGGGCKREMMMVLPSVWLMLPKDATIDAVAAAHVCVCVFECVHVCMYACAFMHVVSHTEPAKQILNFHYYAHMHAHGLVRPRHISCKCTVHQYIHTYIRTYTHQR